MYLIFTLHIFLPYFLSSYHFFFWWRRRRNYSIPYYCINYIPHTYYYIIIITKHFLYFYSKQVFPGVSSREVFLAGRAGRERFFIGRISPEISKKLKYISYFPTKVMEYCTYWLVMYIYFKTIKILMLVLALSIHRITLLFKSKQNY